MANTQTPLIDNKDYDNYENDLAAFILGDLDPNRFLANRLNLGIYAQRQEGMCMVRAKIPGGRIKRTQLIGFAEAVEAYSGTNSVHITTRQDVQFHYVPLEETAKLQRHMGAYGIASREACGNTVRNITSCALAGVCPAEHVDINAYIDQVAHFFVRHPLTASMPRKIKFSFSGCAKDCAHGMAHDIGVIATHKDGKPGFKLLAAGGLGSCPREAFELEMFIEEDQLLASIGAVLTLHNQYSDRKRKMRSRTKFLVDKFGIDEFKAKYQDALLRTKDAFHMEAGRVAKWRTPTMKPEEVNTNLRTPVAQHQDDLNVLPVTVTNGEIKVSQLRALAELLEREGLNQLHTSQDQNFSVFNIPTDRLGAVTVALRDIGFKTPRCGDRVVSCPGTETCPLGITASRHIVPRLSGGVGDLAVRINGCQNGCANSAIAEIGLYGKGRRHYGRLVPSYGLNLGGDGGKGGGIGITGPDIPAVRIPSAVKIIHDDYHADRLPNENFCHFVKRVGNEYFEETLGHLSHVGSSEIAFLTRDHGDSSMFKVESQGIGECAGVTAAPADKLLFDAQYESELCAAFASKNKQDNAAESLVNQVLFIGRALLEATGCEPTDRYDLETINSKLQQEFKDEPDLLSQYTAFNNEVAAFQDTLDELVLSGLIKTADNLISQVEERVAELHRQTHIATTLMAQRSGTND